MQVRDVYVDTTGNIYVGGTTSDASLPTTPGVFQPNYAGGPDDAFLAKFSPSGNLLWMSYLGTNGLGIEEKVYGIGGVDNQGNLLVCGHINPAATVGGAAMRKFGPSANNVAHAFLAKVRPDGTALVWIDMLGGSGNDSNRGRCTLDTAGNAYGQGGTQSTDFPTTPGAYQTVNRSTTSPPSNGFVAKVSSDGSTLIWSTYIGGSNHDNCLGGMAIDAAGNVFVGGVTSSADIGATVGAYMTAMPSLSADYIAKFASNGVLLALTYLGGSTPAGNSTVPDLMSTAIDGAGNIVVMGYTPMTDFPVTAGVFQAKFAGGNNDGFVAKLDNNLRTLLAATFVGGSGTETGDDSARLQFDAAGNIWTALTTTSTDFPTTTNAYSQIYAGGAHDQVVFGLSADLKTLVYASYLGGNADDFNRSFAIR